MAEAQQGQAKRQYGAVRPRLITYQRLGRRVITHNRACANTTGLQGQTSAAVINEMKDSLIDHYA